MSANANIVDVVKGPSTLVRPRFSPGLLLRDDDLRAGVDYTRDLSRLLFRSLFGCGVVCGLEVTSVVECGKLIVTVKDGLALNCVGDPIHVPEAKSVTIDPTCGRPIPDTVWVTLCRTAKCCAPRSAACACDEEDGGSVCTREHDQFEINVTTEPGKCLCNKMTRPKESERTSYQREKDCWCADPCLDCHKNHYQGVCGCECCDDDCVVLAVLEKTAKSEAATGQGHPAPGGSGTGTTAGAAAEWIVNHSVRRFVRPVLMRDPLVFKEQYNDVLCPKETVIAEDQQQQAQSQAGDIATVDEAARTAAWAARALLLKGTEARAAAAAGRLDEAEAAATELTGIAAEVEASTRIMTAEVAKAAAVAQADVEKAVSAKRAADQAAAEKIAAERLEVERLEAVKAAAEAPAAVTSRRTKKTTPPPPAAG